LSCTRINRVRNKLEWPFERKHKSTHPNNYSSGLILSSDLEISTFGDVVEEEPEEVFGFLIFISNDTTGISLIDEQSLFTCDGMNTNNWMLVKYLID